MEYDVPKRRDGGSSATEEAALWIGHVIEKEEEAVFEELLRLLEGRLPLDASEPNRLAAIERLRKESPEVDELCEKLESLVQLDGGRYVQRQPALGGDHSPN